jgi:hypothetical protein
VLVGKTATGGNTAGMQIIAGSFFSHVRDGGVVQVLNRKTSDGDILQFEKDNSTVGSIGIVSGNNLKIHSTSSGHSGLSFGTGIVYATDNSGDATNGGTDLGSSSYTWKDIYLSGGVNFSANSNDSGMTSELLDDYEEGTFDPTFTPASGSITPYTSYNTFAYTKVGRVVTITGTMATQSVSSPSGALTFGNLPFAMASDTPNRASLARPSIHIYATGSAAPTQNKYYSAFIAFAHQGTSGDVFATYNATHDDSIADWFAAGSDMFVNFSYITNS